MLSLIVAPLVQKAELLLLSGHTIVEAQSRVACELTQAIEHVLCLEFRRTWGVEARLLNQECLFLKESVCLFKIIFPGVCACNQKTHIKSTSSHFIKTFLDVPDQRRWVVAHTTMEPGEAPNYCPG
jgi:hypothetical protein